LKIKNQNPKDYFSIIFIFALSCLLSFGIGFQMLTYHGLPVVFITMLLSFLLHWIAFIPAYFFKTEKFYDILGTIAYLSVTGLAVFFTIYLSQEKLHLRSIFVASLIIIWALRLGIFLLIRVLKNGEDRRFREPMQSFSKFLLWWSMSAFWVFLTTLNAITMLINNMDSNFDAFFIVGLILWISGFIIELVSDEQKRKFKLNPENDGNFISSGLWSFSRHPNYFGEIVLWIGIAVMSIPTLEGMQFLSLISPIFIYFLLTNISGVNLLEERADNKWGKQMDYQDYKRKTPILNPFRRTN
jgi:steroid 5-alpha reductase family enzyme